MDNNLKVYWYGYGGNSVLVESKRQMIESLGMSLITIHEWNTANIPWDLNTVYKELKNADIIIIPANYKKQPCKSNNRLTQAMALGKPIICEPMPAYVSIVDNYKNAILLNSDSETEWFNALKVLKENKELRDLLSKNALETSKKYSLENTAKQWINALIFLNNKGDRKVDVVIPTKNNHEILDICLKSFENSTLEEEIYIVDNGSGVEDLVKKYNVPYEIRNV